MLGRQNEWENRALLQRGMHISAMLKKFLSADYKNAIEKILELIATFVGQ